MTTITVGILFGGRSAEHEVSLRSVQNIIEALDTSRYLPVLLGCTKEGSWRYYEHLSLLNADDPKTIALDESKGIPIFIDVSNIERPIVTQTGKVLPIEVVFPVLHGPYGEDGTIQGMFKLLNLPCVGAGVLGSAIGMDKDVMKRLLREAGLPIGHYHTVTQKEPVSFTELVATLGTPLFIKPANMGSSVGVSKVKTAAEYEKALAEAFHFDSKVLAEEAIVGREIECAILGTTTPIASTIGEIVAHQDFYSYDAKYIDDAGATLHIPAVIPPAVAEKAQCLAIQVFTTLECYGLGRVDMFLCPDGQLIINEINTIPGFTSNSMYPKLFEEKGISYQELISKLIEYALNTQ